MTATQADMRVCAIGPADILAWFDAEQAAALAEASEHDLGDAMVAAVEQPRGELVLCEMPDDSAAALRVGVERDWCTPGAWSGTVFALAEAGIGKAGGPGVAELHRRELAALRRANALAEALQSIGQVLKDALRDMVREPGRERDIATIALGAVEGLVDSVAAELDLPAREVLAAHGWAEDEDRTWAHQGDECSVCFRDGEACISDDHPSPLTVVGFPPVVLRAFATLAGESRS